jgi:putative NADH-flavin reductase
MKLLVIGATGPAGLEICRHALKKGYAVTALIRNIAKAVHFQRVEIAIGNVLDLASLKKALAHQDAVICSLGSAASGPFKKVFLLSEGTRNLVNAMQDQGVKRLICITGVGAGESKGHGPWYYNRLIQPLMLRGVYEDKTRQEEVVRHSGLFWTLVRPALLTNKPAKGLSAVRTLTELPGSRISTISRADVAAFCLQELADGHYLNQAPVITY